MRLTGPRQEIRNLQRAHPSLGELKDEPGLAGDPAPHSKRRPGTLVLPKLLRSLKDAGKAATSNYCLWPNTLAAQSLPSLKLSLYPIQQQADAEY